MEAGAHASLCWCARRAGSRAAAAMVSGGAQRGVLASHNFPTRYFVNKGRMPGKQTNEHQQGRT
jgi:hypothetical protein